MATTCLLPALMEPPALDTAGAFCDRLLSLSAAFIRFTRAEPQICIPFLLRGQTTPLYGFPTFCVTYPSADGHLGCVHFMVVRNNAD